MLTSLPARIVCALAAMFTTGHRTPAARFATPDTRADSAAAAMIVEELHAFYRDLHDHNPTSMVMHFYPAKVTARFAVPARDSVWAALEAPPQRSPTQSPEHSSVSPDARAYCTPQFAIAIVGNWARVRARRCTGELDEAWFYRMSSRWKIIHLELGSTLTTLGAALQ